MLQSSWLSAFRLITFMTFLLGFLYPLLITCIAWGFFSKSFHGGIVYRNNKPVGSIFVGQSFVQPMYFHARPSAVSYNPLPSGGSQLGPTSKALLDTITQREKNLMLENNQTLPPPQDLLFASGSGLDPDISLPAAQYQAGRVAKFRNIPIKTVEGLIFSLLKKPQMGFMGEPRINVLEINLKLDELYN